MEGIHTLISPKVDLALSLPLCRLNHISFKCRSLTESFEFYTRILGFLPIRRPDESLQFCGIWLYNFGLGIHLGAESDTNGGVRDRQAESVPKEINPRANHISFQADDLQEVERRLKVHGIPYVKQDVKEDGITVKQVFFHDPDDNMIEICNCELLPIVPINVSIGFSGIFQTSGFKRLSSGFTPKRRISALENFQIESVYDARLKISSTADHDI